MIWVDRCTAQLNRSPLHLAQPGRERRTVAEALAGRPDRSEHSDCLVLGLTLNYDPCRASW